MNAKQMSPRLLRCIFVAPSSTVLVQDVTSEWDAMRLRERLQSRRTSECDEMTVGANSASAPDSRGGV